MRRTIVVGLAMLLVLSSLAVIGTPTAAHVRSDTRSYVGNCDLVLTRCVDQNPDPTGEVCASGTCWTGGATWGDEAAVQLHDGQLGDGLDVRASIEDDLRDPTWGRLCVAQAFSDSDPEGNICDDPESEPDESFCDTSPWLPEALKHTDHDRDVDGDGTVEDPEWIGVFVGGPVTQVLSHLPGPEPARCDPLGAGAFKGTVAISVRE